MIDTKDCQYDILLGHAQASAALAEAVRQRLADVGVSAFSPFAGLRPDEYEEHVRPAFDQTRAYAALVSRAFLDSPLLLVEAAAGWALRVPVYLLLDDVRPTDVSGFLAQFPAYPLWKGFPSLVAAVRALPERVPA